MRNSIALSLSLRLCAVGLIGLAVLMVMIILDYHITFSALNDPRALSRAIDEVRKHVGLPALVIFVPLVIVSFGTVIFALRPIRRAAEEIARSSQGGPGVRIDGTRFPAEITPLAEAVNALLLRLEQEVEYNAAFAADVAHELRTPLTLLGLELDRIGGADGERLRGQVAGMQKLVNQLLQIAQVDGSVKRGERLGKVDLHAVATAALNQLASTALASGQMLALDDLGSTPATGEAESLAAALRNLLENALRVSPAGSTVTVAVGPGARLAVSDAGPGLTPDDLQRLLARHVRADNASRDGAGLGLAIVARIVAAHNGRLVSDPATRTIAMLFPEEPPLSD